MAAPCSWSPIATGSRERFRQGAHGRRGVRGGNGLGLAIVRTLVEAHGGTVAAADRAGAGADLEALTLA